MQDVCESTPVAVPERIDCQMKFTKVDQKRVEMFTRKTAGKKNAF